MSTFRRLVKVSGASKGREGLIDQMRRLGSLNMCEPLKPVLPVRAATHRHDAVAPLTWQAWLGSSFL
jgi:hypothetical protein